MKSQRRLTRQESHERTRMRLIEAAESLFIRKGFDDTSVDEISETAGYSRGAFYSNFEDKEGILEALIEREHNRLLEYLDAHFAEAEETAGSWLAASGRDADPTEIVAPLVDRILSSLPGDRLVSLVQTELEIHTIRRPEASRSFVEADAAFRDLIGAHIERGLARLGRKLSITPRQAADAVIGLAERSVRVTLLSADGDRDALARAVLPRLLLAMSHPA